MIKDWTQGESTSKSNPFSIKLVILLTVLFVAGIFIGLKLREFHWLKDQPQTRIVPALGEVHFAWDPSQYTPPAIYTNDPSIKNTQPLSSAELNTTFDKRTPPLPTLISNNTVTGSSTLNPLDPSLSVPLKEIPKNPSTAVKQAPKPAAGATPQSSNKEKLPVVTTSSSTENKIEHKSTSPENKDISKKNGEPVDHKSIDHPKKTSPDQNIDKTTSTPKTNHTDKEAKGANKEATGSKKEATSAKKETTGTKKETTSTKKETTSTKKETTSTKKETTSAKKETTSTKKEIASTKRQHKSTTDHRSNTPVTPKISPAGYPIYTEQQIGQLHAKKYTLQVRAFRGLKEAEKFLHVLTQKWNNQRDFYILQAISKGKNIYRVRVGYVSSRDETKQLRRQFIKLFGSQDKPFIKRIKYK